MTTDFDIGLYEPFGCLRDVKVVLTGGATAGPFGADLLAENGAQVIHVESTTVPDVLRTYSKRAFAQDHRNVYEIALDIPSEKGKEVFKRLIERSDVLFECYKAGQYAKWGITDEILWEWNPKLVICHLSGYGQTGDPDYTHRASFDMIGQAFSGISMLNGMPEPGLPDFAKPMTCDYVTGMTAALAITMALYRVEKTGVGESIDVSQYESLLRIQNAQIVNGLTDGTEPIRYTGIDERVAGDSYYKCKDGKYVTIVASGKKPVAGAVQLLGIADDPEFEGVAMFFKGDPRAEKFVQLMRDFCMQHDAAEVEAKFAAAGVPCCQLMTYQDMLTNPHYVAREDIIEFYSSNAGEVVKAPAPAPKFARNPQKVWRGGAKHGEDNDIVLGKLGFADEEIATMYESGVVSRLG